MGTNITAKVKGDAELDASVTVTCRAVHMDKAAVVEQDEEERPQSLI